MYDLVSRLAKSQIEPIRADSQVYPIKLGGLLLAEVKKAGGEGRGRGLLRSKKPYNLLKKNVLSKKNPANRRH